MRLSALGYYPVPIPLGSKGPTISGWDKLRLTPEQVPAYFTDAGLVGCLHANLACFDIDVTDPALAEEIVAEGFRRFPGALERVGRAPKSAIVLRLDEPGFKVHNTEKHEVTTPDGEVMEAQVEVRTLTRQMVVYGVHPDTQRPYRWPRGELWATPWGDLPPLEQSAAQDFRDWCNARIRAWAGAEKPSAKIIDIGDHRPSRDERMSEASFLKALSYVPPSLGHEAGWRETLMGIHDFFAGSARGLDVAKDWSSADPRYSPQEVEAKWRSFEVGKGVSYRTVLHHAKQHGCDMAALARAEKPEIKLDDLSDFPTSTGAQVIKPKPTTPLEWFDDVSPSLTDAYLIKGVLAEGAMSVVYGPSNSGKTFFALDVAFHVAIGSAWRGQRVGQASVLYLAAEGGRGVLNRIAALRQETGICDVPLALRRAGMDLLHDQADLQTVVNLAAEVKARLPDRPQLIVIDTLSRIMAGGDENSAQDMTALIRNIDAIREATGAHIMLVHHTGKDVARGARGHSSLRAATDTEIEVGNENGARAAMVTKQRDYTGNETFPFTLKSVSLGQDQDGDDVTSCVVEAQAQEDYKAAAAAQKPLGANQRILLETFDQLIGDGLGQPNPAGPGFPDPGRHMTVKMDLLRDTFCGKIAAANKRGAFIDAWNALSINRGILKAASETVWRTDRKIKQ